MLANCYHIANYPLVRMMSGETIMGWELYYWKNNTANQITLPGKEVTVPAPVWSTHECIGWL